jgi:type II secretory ATPase GspE/PulE/Tfp pilus assembly ATPase PilB-like protein/CheY-like chemotaxis protein
MHWLVQMAKHAGWPGSDALGPMAHRPTAEVWPLVARALGWSQEDLAAAVAARVRVAVADTAAAEPHALRLIPAQVARQHHVFPLRETHAELFVATAEPLDAGVEQAVGFVAGRRVVFEVATPAAIDTLIVASYGFGNAALEGLLESVNTELADAIRVVDESDAVRLEDAADGPVIRLTNYIIHEAISRRASDIHIAPGGATATVRLRVDGVLRHHMHLPPGALTRVISRIKVLGRMDIADRIRPQDGRARVALTGRTFDLRISVVPTRDAEKAVIRILDPTTSPSLDDIDMPPQELARLYKLLGFREGIVFVTGPTGSGKTTTLYAALRELSARDINITTVEDPVEYDLPGITQIQVEPKRGVTFASALRAILRQDPDVILVGEIRDLETAQIAVQAAMTGHLVLGTLHTNDAVGIVARLVDIGLDRPSIAASVRGGLGQRLVRRVCRHCTQPATAPLTAEEERLQAIHGVAPTVRAVGCERCGDSGYYGRAAIAEVLVVTPAMAEMIATGANNVALQRAALAAGMRTLYEVGLERVRSGETTLQEIERVLGEMADERVADAPSSSERPRVLLVEDDPVQARFARSILEKHDFQVTEAADGLIAWAHLMGVGGISLVVTDLRMPNLDGAALLERMRRTVATASLPVVVLTAAEDEAMEIDLLGRGADDYIRKPLEPARFMARVRAALRRSEGAASGSVPTGAAPGPAAGTPSATAPS